MAPQCYDHLARATTVNTFSQRSVVQKDCYHLQHQLEYEDCAKSMYEWEGTYFTSKRDAQLPERAISLSTIRQPFNNLHLSSPPLAALSYEANLRNLDQVQLSDSVAGRHSSKMAPFRLRWQETTSSNRYAGVAVSVLLERYAYVGHIGLLVNRVPHVSRTSCCLACAIQSKHSLLR